MKRILLFAVILILISIVSGCIRSRVVVTSEPSGADLTMNNTYRGRTPLTIPFAWYWYYDFEVEKEGYRRLESRERFKAPVWFWMPFDLVCEAMPFNIYDTKRLHYSLTPSVEEDIVFNSE
mgnify:FL=1